MKTRSALLLGSTLAVLLNSTAFGQTAEGYDTTLDHMTIAVNGVRVGVWTQGQLAVTGNITASGVVQVGQTTAGCSSVNAGAIRFNTSTNTFEGCNGTYWQAFSVPTTYSASNTTTIYCPANKQAVSGGGECGNGIWVNGGNHQPAIGWSAPILANNSLISGDNQNGVTGNIGWFVACVVDQGSSTVPSTVWVNCQ